MPESGGVSDERERRIREFWEAVREKRTRKEIAAALSANRRGSMDPSNLDTHPGFQDLRTLMKAASEAAKRRASVQTASGDPLRWATLASHDFLVNMRRYRSLVRVAEELNPGNRRGAPTTERQHLYQAAVVLGIGSFDAYFRQFIVEGYRILFRSDLPVRLRRSRLRERVHWAIKTAVGQDPELLLEIARADPEEAEDRLVEEVLTVQNIRLLTGRWGDVTQALGTLGISLADTDQPAERQFVRVAGDVFDAYADARHVSVHAGNTSTGDIWARRPATFFCTNSGPVMFLGEFLTALVAVIDSWYPSSATE